MTEKCVHLISQNDLDGAINITNRTYRCVDRDGVRRGGIKLVAAGDAGSAPDGFVVAPVVTWPAYSNAADTAAASVAVLFCCLSAYHIPASVASPVTPMRAEIATATTARTKPS